MKGVINLFYWIALGILIIRVVTFGSTWLFDDGSYYVLGHLVAEGIILIAFIKLLRERNKLLT